MALLDALVERMVHGYERNHDGYKGKYQKK